jgi:putative NIF3 family GTP cyclohydrolase 1 type 2
MQKTFKKQKIMELELLKTNLDTEFDIMDNDENLVEFAVTDDNKKYFHPDFLKHKTGLLNFNSTEIKKVYTTVFITNTVIEKIKNEKNILILTHHHFDYYEDERGLQPIRPEIFEILQERENSIYVAHAPLDTHKIYGTSVSLAELCNIKIEELFYDYFGAPTALIGHIDKTDFNKFSELVRHAIKRPYLTLHKYIDSVEKIAVVAGGGDMPDILLQVYDFECDTLLTGTVEHRWALPFIQEENRKFHELNYQLKRNLIGGTHFATERPAMIKVLNLIRKYGIKCEYCEDENLLNSK